MNSPLNLSRGSKTCKYCYITMDETERNRIMISPCSCSGSLSNVHKDCLERWLEQRDRTEFDEIFKYSILEKKCEICHESFPPIFVKRRIHWPQFVAECLNSLAAILVFYGIICFGSYFILIFLFESQNVKISFYHSFILLALFKLATFFHFVIQVRNKGEFPFSILEFVFEITFFVSAKEYPLLYTLYKAFSLLFIEELFQVWKDVESHSTKFLEISVTPSPSTLL
jgi:hypothetical protein